MAKEYISREAAIIGLAASSLMPHQIDDAAEALKLVPAADVVEVVRCCECAYHDDDSLYHYCRKWRKSCPDDSEFYCKWGKRKDGGQDE